jgi:hypothetical protein
MGVVVLLSICVLGRLLHLLIQLLQSSGALDPVVAFVASKIIFLLFVARNVSNHKVLITSD